MSTRSGIDTELGTGLGHDGNVIDILIADVVSDLLEKHGLGIWSVVFSGYCFFNGVRFKYVDAKLRRGVHVFLVEHDLQCALEARAQHTGTDVVGGVLQHELDKFRRPEILGEDQLH